MSAVSQPAHYVGTLWKPREGEIDPEPLHEPASLNLSSPSSLCNSKDEHMTCARVRAFQGRNKEEFNQPTQKVKPYVFMICPYVVFMQNFNRG